MFIVDHKLPKNLSKLLSYFCKEYEGYLQDNFVKITKNKSDLIRKAVSCFLINANNCILKNRKTFGVNISSDRFSENIIINGRDTKRKVSHRYFKSFINFLSFEDYGELDKGGDYTGHSIIHGQLVYDQFTKSRFTLSTRFLNIYSQLVKECKGFNKIDNVLILRDKNKKPVVYKRNDKIRGKIDYLNLYNKFTLTIPVTSGEKILDMQIYKVGNENFDNGMRSFTVGEYQHMNKKERSEVLIGGEKTVCYDFKGFEPSLAYSVNQEIMEFDDPYHIEELIDLGYDKEVCRKIVKKVLIVCLNTSCEKEAKQAINYLLVEDFDLDKLYRKNLIPTRTIPVSTFINAILDKHYLISDCFFTSKGLGLQAIGAAINDYILENLMQNHKVLCLQVHDDFRVAEKYENLLPDIMFKAYEHVLGFNDNCKIEKES